MRVRISVAADGAGVVTATVRFDDGVLFHVPDLDEILRLDDVRASGWVVDQRFVDGGLELEAAKPFGSIDVLPLVLGELDGPDGIFGDAALDVDRNGEVTTYALSVEVDLDRRVTDLIDPEVAEVLDGEIFGVPMAELERRAGGPLDEAVSLVVEIEVPGGEHRHPAAGASRLNDGGRLILVAEGSIVDSEIAAADAAAASARDDVSDAARQVAVVWSVLVAVVLVVAIVVVAAGRRRRRRHL